MNLDDLNADDLSVIDAVCLEFEQRFGSAAPMTVEQAIKLFIDRKRGSGSREQIELLRQELEAIGGELELKRQAANQPGAVAPTPFRPRAGARDWLAGDPSFSQSKTTEWDPALSGPGQVAGSVKGFSQSKPPVPGEQSAEDPVAGGPVSKAGAGDAESEPGSAPDSIGPYAIGRVLARGGMGVVYRAFDTRLERPVAIKMMGFPNLAPADPKRIELVERFEREAKAVAALSHPNIVELFDVGVAGSLPYAVMEFLSGLTVADQLAAGPMSPAETCQIGMQIAGALATAHAAGVVHRDLKPQNVMLVDVKDSEKAAALRVKLVDFGLSRVSDSALPQDDDNSNQTRSGMILGTPGYMAPEQARGEPATSAADMFGLGCLLYEIFYGKPAIPGETPADRLAGTLKGEVEYDHVPCEQSKVLCELISECLNKDPAKRPSATDVYGRLRQFDLSVAARGPAVAVSSGVGELQSSEGWMRRHVLTTLAGGLLGSIVGGVSFGVSDRPIGKIESLAVLTLRDLTVGGRQQGPDGKPLEDRMISDGETLASALVNELSEVDGLAVLPYRPQSAETPEQFVRLGRELNVDAFLTGSFESQTKGQQRFWVVNWQLVSARDGNVLGAKQFVTAQKGENEGGQFLAQSAVASDIAKQIGRNLVTSGEKRGAPDPMAYGCMMKGHAYADADSTKGLKQALRCFSKAHEEDPRRSEPLAAIAVASLNLAARSDTAEESLAYLEKARSSMAEALDLEPTSLRGRLAEAMLEWQSLQHYDEAYRLFAELHRQERLDWQILHQRGLLLTALGYDSEAIDSLRTASKLNPLSMMIKTDLCRAHWFFNWETRALRDALRYRDAVADDETAINLVTGFLIDCYEEQRDFAKAAELLGVRSAVKSAEDYYAIRFETLLKVPYGPFGATLNQAIFNLRSGAMVQEEMLGELDDSGATMFPLLLAQHPAFLELRSRPAAEPYLPRVRNRYRSETVDPGGRSEST